MLYDLVIVLVSTSMLLGSMLVIEFIRIQCTRLYRLIHIKKIQKEEH